MDARLYPVNPIRVRRLRGADATENILRPHHGRMVRLYCSMRRILWELQLRAPLGTGFAGLKDGTEFAIASASLQRAELEALRDAITDALAAK